ncbi:LysR family transcriptional regulator [Mameliella sediminis]|uniref:LysR family transcriptional regulator n=1 Tax=Mameliella sediminis TaxID=2836866 RepID=UPI001C487CFF|nr:LysR family transcriptional regulator [Mameliella sediminis]MBY6114437.1 LysR family transcriptional regulator [Antarctobacter heliothermus]MBY6144010.1 LysR family transcriptional regulator [Mameliella alba]MBV7393082.1 LysR family transcriptional regulator [Mameliella sediminis]MBY6161699.1 LysR family transcriptional regulator [Mameliella alba]MBY6169835.1 LysR family transcriptional regulator [Mameliella alba]
MRIKLDDLQAFVAVAEFGSFARASDELNITQSALSRRLKKLEEALGARLLDRTTRQVSVSVVGAEFLPEAMRIVAEVNRSLSDITDLIKVRTGTVSIASNMTISDTLLPEILSAFKKRHPNVRVRVSESSSPAALERVLHRESELAVAQFGEGHPELEFEPLFEDRFVLISHRDHPIAGRKGLTWKDLSDHNFIRMRAGSGTTNLLQRSLGEDIRHLSGDIEVGHFNALLAMVGKNLGLSAIPTLVQLKRVDLDIVATPVSDPVISRQLGIVTYRGRSLSPAGEALRQTCREVLRETVPSILGKISARRG